MYQKKENKLFKIIQIPILTDNYSYLISDENSAITACIDPGNFDEIDKCLKENDLKLDYILSTHHHIDHVGGNLLLKKKYECKIVGNYHDRDRIPGIDIELKDSETFSVGNNDLIVIETPGHTVGHICYHFEDNSTLFSGDTLFSLGCGRLFEGSCEQMVESILKLRSLPGNTKLYCGHEYTESNAKFAFHLNSTDEKLKKKIQQIQKKREKSEPTIPSTISEEIELNPFMKFDDKKFLDLIGIKNISDEENFKKLRKMKDEF